RFGYAVRSIFYLRKSARRSAYICGKLIPRPLVMTLRQRRIQQPLCLCLRSLKSGNYFSSLCIFYSKRSLYFCILILQQKRSHRSIPFRQSCFSFYRVEQRQQPYLLLHLGKSEEFQYFSRLEQTHDNQFQLFLVGGIIGFVLRQPCSVA